MKSMLLRDQPECAGERNSPNEIWSVYTVISWFSGYGGVSFASWELSYEGTMIGLKFYLPSLNLKFFFYIRIAH